MPVSSGTFQRLDLVGGSHQAQFGGDGTAGATDEQQRGQHRRQFAVQRQAEQGRQRVGRTEGGQRAVTLQGQHQADESAADGDDRQRARADLVDLAGQLGQEITRGQRTAQHGQREQAGAAQRTGGLHERHQATLARGAASNGMGPSGWPCRNCRSSGSWLDCSASGVPWNTMPPLAMAITWSQIGRVSCTWWLTMMLVRPRLWLRRWIRLMITPEAIGSSPVSGSS
ncbi:hypothetical protein G6F66_013613 [Rhizopus arrhizus]|nr:hypothetical protein G6F66_013613 [Rhizopus arrhizus]